MNKGRQKWVDGLKHDAEYQYYLWYFRMERNCILAALAVIFIGILVWSVV